jgi:uncharacterized protein YraI
MSLLRTTAIAIALSAIGATAAAATEATTALNVRAGPGTSYSVVDVLRAGEDVSVRECRTNGWCLISHSGPDGWVSSNYLTDVGRTAPTPPVRSEPRVSVDFSVPGFSFFIGNGRDFRPRPGRHTGRVCFYEDFDYRGRSFCARPGDADRRLGRGWNDTISSIRVIGDAQARVCEDFNFNGRCAVLDRSRASLGGRNNDIISSYRVR